nr:MAG TPA: hypothetical protein [Caudoviricetes sp.]
MLSVHSTTDASADSNVITQSSKQPLSRTVVVITSSMQTLYQVSISSSIT